MRNTDAPRRLRAIVAGITIAAATLAAHAPVAAADDTRPAQHATTASWIDTTNRRAVLDAYNTEFNATTPDIGWTGNHTTCDNGTTNPAHRAATFRRINWYRSMAGLAPVTESAAMSAEAQQGVLTAALSAEGELFHEPPPDAPCYTAASFYAAGRSNLYKGRSGPAAIDGYIRDHGNSNVSAGHRNWILSPTAQQFGTGDAAFPYNGGTRHANVLRINEGTRVVFQRPTPPTRDPNSMVAWPTPGYNPAATVYERWSLSIRDADFTGATVTTRHIAGGTATNVASPVVYQKRSKGAPFDIIVWEPQLNFAERPPQSGTATIAQPEVDQTYRVTINNVRINGTLNTITYTVTIIGDQPASAAPDFATSVTSPNAAADRAWADAAHTTFLGRNATPPEQQSWADQLAAGTTRHQLIRGLTQSDDWIAVVVDKMYQDTLGRPADPVGRSFWIDRVRNGLTVAGMAAHFYSSPEYIDQSGSTEAWIEDLYVELLERRPDAAGLDYWTAEPARTSNYDVARRFYQSEESRRTRVQNLYLDILGRNSDQGGETFWADVLIHRNDLDLAAELAISDEYYRKARD